MGSPCGELWYSVPMARFLLLAAALSVLPLGCKSPKERYLEGVAALDARHKPAIASLEEHLRVARKKALKKPALEERSGKLSPALSATNSVDAKPNAVIMNLGPEVCDEPIEQGVPFLFAGGHPFCLWRVPRKGQVGLDQLKRDEAEKAVERHKASLEVAVSLRYALFVETRDFDKPRLVGADTFHAGHYRAAVRVYDLSSDEYLGGFEVEARSDSSLGVGKHESEKTVLSLDLRNQTAAALSKALTEFCGSKNKLELGYSDEAFD